MIWKLMLKYFFGWYCVMHYSFIPEDITASEASDMEVLALMQEADFLINFEDCVLVHCCLLLGTYLYVGGKFLEEF